MAIALPLATAVASPGSADGPLYGPQCEEFIDPNYGGDLNRCIDETYANANVAHVDTLTDFSLPPVVPRIDGAHPTDSEPGSAQCSIRGRNAYVGTASGNYHQGSFDTDSRLTCTVTGSQASMGSLRITHRNYHDGATVALANTRSCRYTDSSPCLEVESHTNYRRSPSNGYHYFVINVTAELPPGYRYSGDAGPNCDYLDSTTVSCQVRSSGRTIG